MRIQIAIFLIIWLVAVIIIIRKNWSKKLENSGLTAIFLATLSLNYWFAALIYILPWYPYGPEEFVLKGFSLVTYAILAFGFGNLVLSRFFIRPIRTSRLNNEREDSGDNQNDKGLVSKLPRIYLILGFVSYFILPSILGEVPTLKTLINVGGNLLIVAICLGCWQAYRENNEAKLKRWIISSLIFPLITIIRAGFIGVGFSSTLVILIFAARLWPLKRKTVIAGLIIGYLAISLYQSYMRDRVEIREVVWGGFSLKDRIRVVMTSFRNFEWFNPFNIKHLERITGRIDMNYLSGMIVNHMEAGGAEYAHGQTIQDSFIALAPRILWPEKQEILGGVNMASKYSGLIFGEEVSVGIGIPMEFYINFATLGVIIGLLILGIILAIIDTRAGYYLAKGNVQGFIIWFLPGITFINSGSVVELVSATVAAIIVAHLISKFLTGQYRLMLILLALYFIMKFILNL